MKMQPAGMPTMPRTRLATAQVLVPEMASPTVPSMVKGRPQPRQLLEERGLWRLQRGHLMKRSPVLSAGTISGALWPAAA